MNRLLLVLVLAAVLTLQAQAKVVFVNKNATGATHDGASWVTACLTVTAGLNTAVSGDELWVAAPTPAAPAYVETLTVPSGVALYGGFNGTENNRDMRNWKANVTTLDGGGASGAVACRSSSTLDGFRVRNATTCLVAGDLGVTLSHNTFADFGYGTAIDDLGAGGVTISNNAIDGGGKGNWGVQARGAVSSLVRGNTVVGCWEAVRVTGQAVVSNNTLVYNSSGLVANGSVSAANNIAAYNSYWGVAQITESGHFTAYSHNCVYGNAYDYAGFTPPADGGNFSRNPRLTWSMHIMPDSPCRDSGDDSAVLAGSTDMDGQPRIQGAHVDIGADESDGTAVDAPVAWRVSPAGDDANDGLTWQNARKSIAAVTATAHRDDEIWVAAGTYNGTVVIPAGVALYGGFSGTETNREQRNWTTNVTILDGGSRNNTVEVVTCKAESTLDGFHVRNAQVCIDANEIGVLVSHNTVTSYASRGVMVFAGTVSNNVFAGPGVSGVLAQGGGAIIVGNLITGHEFGDGIFVIGDSVLINNTITGNHDGVCLSGAARLTNNIIAYNSSQGIWYQSGSVTEFGNNDVFGNAKDYDGYTPPAGQGNISLDPCFVDRANGDYHLLAGSPCIDAGDDSEVLPGETGVDGNPRILGLHVDMGAYEFQGAYPPLIFSVQPGDAHAGIPFGSQPLVYAVDANGHLDTSFTAPVSISIKPGTGRPGAVLLGTTTFAAVAGVATFTDLSIDLAGQGYVLVPSSGTLIGGDSAPFSVAQVPTKLAFSVQPAGAYAGFAFTTQPVVSVLDAENNVATSYSGAVALAVKAGSGSPGGALTGATAVNAVSGVAAFSGLKIDPAGTGYVLTASSGTLTPAESQSFDVPVRPGLPIYVNKNATGTVHDGVSWATAFTTVQAGINAAISGDEVWVAASTPAAPAYVENVTLKAGVSMYGGFAGTETARGQRDWKANPTVLDGNGSTSANVVVVRYQGSTVDGLTIQRGGKGVYVYTVAATISHCTIAGNAGYGVYALNGTPNVNNCVIRGNGDGLYVYGGTASATNCTIVANSSRGVSTTAPVSLSNCIIAFNATGISGNASTSVSHSDVYGNTIANYANLADPTGTNANISADPLFVDRQNGDLRLRPGSPCIDAGDDSAVTSGDTDQDGKPRLTGSHVDMGAYESGSIPPVVGWRLAATSGPSPRSGHVMAYDSSHGRTVLFGGWDGASNLSDTWEWDGAVWHQVATTGPSARSRAVATYDGARGKTVLFGGISSGYLGDTWEWDGSVWQQVATAGPSGRGRSMAAFDSGHGRTVLYGGFDGWECGDTWTWDGIQWTQLSVSGPGARKDAAMAYDSARGKALVQGGTYATPNDSTWTWDGARWQQVATGDPGSRSGAAIAFDSARGKAVLFGGSSTRADTWEWDGTQWSQSGTTGPSARSGCAMAFDSARGNCVLFGGSSGSSLLGETWVYGPLSATPPFTLADAARCLSITGGLASPSGDDLSRLNVESGNAALDLNDALRIARKVSGLEANP